MSNNPVIRIPNLPIGQIVDKDGNPTDDELTFRQTLVSNLQQNFGNEGLVMPTQDPTSITTIQNNQNEQGQYTCQLGTIIYDMVDPLDYTQDKVLIAVRADNNYPMSAPIFKQVTLT